MTLSRCARCSQDNPAEARFCLSCGAALAVACAGCGATVRAGAKFCGACGQPVEARPPASYTPRHLREQILAERGSMRGERKQVTVLFADIVTSTKLALELGPEGLHVLLERFFAVALDEVHRYDGTVNQFLGDGFMALFGAPIAHEDHARRALLAALAVRERAGVELRIGINSGLVVVGAIGDDLRMDYTAFGDSTILAARLQQAAQPGEVFVSENTAAKVSGYFELEPAPPVVVKETTCRPLRLIGLGVRTSPIEETAGLTPFAGRERELLALREILDGVREGQGQMVGLAGEPGLGKSRLTFEFCRDAREPATVLEGRCLSYGNRIPYLPILDVLRQACGLAVGDTPEDTTAKVGLTLAGLELDPDYAPYLLHALGVGAADELAAVDPPMILRRTFDAMRQLLVAETRRRPLVLVIEDLHWIDHTSQELLLELADEVGSAPLLVLTTYRPAYTPPWLARSFATQIALRPLSPAESEQVVHWVLGDGDRDVSSIVARAEGNPFFLEELANSERERTDIPAGTVVPDTVQDVLAARIDRLDSTQKTAIQLAAVLGREFPLTLAESIWDEDTPLLSVLQELKRLEFLREQHGLGGATFAFRHVLTRDVAYDGLLESHRQELHARAGAALEDAYSGRLDEQCELLAYHYAHSTDRPRAADYLELANRKAASQHAMQEAIGYFYDALAILEKLPDSDDNRRRRLALVFDQTPEFHWTHRHQEFHELLLRHEPLVIELNDQALIATFYARLSHRQLIFGHYATALETATRALDSADATGTTEAAALCCMIQEWAHMMLGDYPRAVHAHLEVRKRLAIEFQSVWYMYGQAGVALAYLMSGRWGDALREFDEAAVTGRKMSDNGTVSFADAFAAWVCLEQRDWQRALEFANRAIEVAPTVYFRGFAYGFQAAALCHTGSVDEGLPVLEEVVPAIKASRHELAWIIMAWRLALAYVEAGLLAQARELLSEIHRAATASRAMFFTGASERCLGELALANGDVEEAIQLLRPAVETLRASGSENELALAHAALSRAHHVLGDDTSAGAYFDVAMVTLDRLGTLYDANRLRQEVVSGLN